MLKLWDKSEKDDLGLFTIHVHKITIRRIRYCNIRYIRNSEDNTKSPLWSSKCIGALQRAPRN